MKTYVLATTEQVVRWYVYKVEDPNNGFELIKHLDLGKVPRWSDKESAKAAAQALGLSTWRYVRV